MLTFFFHFLHFFSFFSSFFFLNPGKQMTQHTEHPAQCPGDHHTVGAGRGGAGRGRAGRVGQGRAGQGGMGWGQGQVVIAIVVKK